ncbi:hypothetical protein IW139_001867 [Coemansia sp. RSA 353]|nr:hypothetical protein LPJ62_000472 [Coemansia sp. RSA 2167]KAJ2145135.1 hypothetical protein IW142_002761 [Coemansia sp. RSA 564]KAJ2154152.1 hypothetical protein J3F82_001433 [Coemansia sp. RSA 637]KAJ2218354.1 hypothetical protein EV180_005763 [Coemansia sp. RSA 518]KAJ2265788.1 hypothetical protein J3F81_005712 [Coemansia sp. RSA 371]KAJ2290231.1 hypothetical protein IW141_003397 [Coemansia sp. RSA 355]KAJ2299181.1 hypothetical protein IW139_001867 [Coemansia sp. RSA 353]KAJ2536570.1 hy
MVHSDDTSLMTHIGPVSSHRPAVAIDTTSSKQAQVAPRSNGQRNTHFNSPRKEKPTNRKPQKHLRQPNPGKQDSEQRAEPKSDEDDTVALPTKKTPKSARKQRNVFLMTRDGEDTKLRPLAQSAFSPSEPASSTPKKRGRNRRRQQSPPTPDEPVEPVEVMRTPTRRANTRQFRPMSTPASTALPVHEPTPIAHHTASLPALGPTPVRYASPSGRHGHYAGASFNNSPAASTLPLPPSFLTSPTKSQTSPLNSVRTGIVRDEDVFGVSPPQFMQMGHAQYMPVAGALNERARHLDAMLATAPPFQQQQQFMHPGHHVHHMHSYSAVDLTQSTDMSAMLHKLRLAMNLNERPATVSPLTSAQVNARNSHLTPVYNA